MAKGGGIEGLLDEEKEGAEAEDAFALTVCLKPV